MRTPVVAGVVVPLADEGAPAGGVGGSLARPPVRRDGALYGSVSDYFQLPLNRVVELGSRVRP